MFPASLLASSATVEVLLRSDSYVMVSLGQLSRDVDLAVVAHRGLTKSPGLALRMVLVISVRKPTFEVEY